MGTQKTEWQLKIENIFESNLFRARYLAFFAVFGSLVAAAMMFLKGCVEVVQAARVFWPILFHFQPTSQDDKEVLLSVIPAVDYYLFATVLLIFSMGIYELFISKIDPATRDDDTRPNWLNIRNIDDLKSPIGKVVMMILIVNFFKQAFNINYSNPSDLLYLGGSILLIALALVATQNITPHHSKQQIKTSLVAENCGDGVVISTVEEEKRG